MSARRPQRHSVWATLAIPLALAVLTLAGLIAGLLGDGLYDAFAWIGLGVPLAVVVRCWMRK